VPTYQYVCTDCGQALEVQQNFTDDSLTTCPTCTGRLRKVFNAVGVVFKGSGFYRNDSRAPTAESNGAKESGGSAEKAEKSSGSDSTESGGSKASEKAGGDKPAGKGDKSGSGAGASSGSVKSTASTGSAA
jgi:putative FmdB family regulatory protein